MKKTFYCNYFWRLTLTKQAHLTVTKTLTFSLTVDVMTLLQQVGAKFLFGQGHRILPILVVSILSLEVPVD